MVKCIDIKPSLDSIRVMLTVGKIYYVFSGSVSYDNKYVLVSDDSGMSEVYYCNRFISIEEDRDRKLNSIGI